MTRIVQRHDTSTNWTSVNPILASGEMGVETDTGKFKFGDGQNNWVSLPYAGGTAEGTNVTGTSPIKVENNNVSLNIDNQTIQVNSQGQLACNLDEIGNDLTGKANIDLSNISDAGKQVIKDNAGSSAPTNMVTTDTEQTITGAKKFDSGLNLGLGQAIKSDDNKNIIGDTNNSGIIIGDTTANSDYGSVSAMVTHSNGFEVSTPDGVKWLSCVRGNRITLGSAKDTTDNYVLLKGNTIYTQKASGGAFNNVLDTSNAFKQVKLTQAEYDALTTKDEKTMYVIVG